MRTPNNFSPDYRNQPKTDFFCVHCQRDIKPESKFRWVHVIGGGGDILHPDDEATYDQNDGGNLNFHPVGMECARKIGMEWSISNDAFAAVRGGE